MSTKDCLLAHPLVGGFVRPSVRLLGLPVDPSVGPPVHPSLELVTKRPDASHMESAICKSGAPGRSIDPDCRNKTKCVN
eukprot:12399033-Karenia_brevis.AAC.1